MSENFNQVLRKMEKAAEVVLQEILNEIENEGKANDTTSNNN